MCSVVVNTMVIIKTYIFIVFLVVLSFVSGDEAKGSVVFVIDDTGSMEPELAQVTARTDDIFDAVLKSNASQIDEFIIVTFNDPGVNFRVKTNESLEFKSALGEITPVGGRDCPEMAMTGILLALSKSKPHSFLYVITDASAKDNLLYDDVKALAQEKSIQVNFILTGDCKSKSKIIIEEQQTVYDNLAAATSGQVFHIFKDDVDKIFKYILPNLRSKRINLLRKTFIGHYSCENSAFTVDSKVGDILIALSSPAPLNHNDIVVHGPHGDKTSLEEFIYLQNTFIFKMRGEPGEYTIKIENCANITVVVSASTSVSFRYGFSSVKPSTLDETSTKPVLGTESYLAIALTNEERDITLKSVDIRDMDNNLIAPLLTLQSIDDEKQFYITTPLLFTPPKETFKILVNGYTKSNENITMVSQTSIEYHKPLRQWPETRTPPTVTVIGPKKVPAAYHKSVELKCKVNGFPKPRIWWEDEFVNVMPDSKVIEIAPNEYISIFQIRNVTNNATYICWARNFAENSDNVTVIAENKSFLNVLEYPKDITVEFGDPVELDFKIDSQLPAKINWYRDNVEINNNEDIEIITSPKGSCLKIKSARPSLDGKYSVMASKVDHKVKYEFEITVKTKKKAAIVNMIIVNIIEKNEVTNCDEQSLKLNCKVEGFPEPSITWEDQYHNVLPSKITRKTPPYEYISTLHIDNATESGPYTCKAKNFEEDSESIKVVIKKKTFFNVLQYPKDIQVKYGESVELNLKIDAKPPAKIIWYQNNTEIKSNHNFHVSVDSSVLIITNVQPGLEGKYYVKASNSDKQVDYEFHVTVPIKIKTPVERKFDVKLGTRLILPCEANGYPEPKVQWFHYPKPPKITWPYKIDCDKNNNVILEEIQLKDEGIYRCTAYNNIDSDQITYTVIVQVPAMIDRKMVMDDLQVVEEDPSFVLTCPTTGSPKPTIKWQHDGIEIESDAVFKISNDGSLTVNNVVSRHRGTYTCIAQNQYGKDTMNYGVYVHAYPPIEPNPHKITITEGEKKYVMFCGMTLETGFLVRWFKDGVFIKEGDLTLIDVNKDDAGYYICRLSTPRRSYSFHKRVIVGTEPKFIFANNPTVMFKDGAVETLDCSATGDPLPKIIWWYEDTIIINVDLSQFSFVMDVNNIGNYSCSVSNEFGTIKRSFYITAGECLMSLENDFTARQPILVTGKNKQKWPIFNVSGGILRMPKYREFTLVCPNAVISYDNAKYGSILKTSCVGDSMFELRGMAVKASEITCDRPIVPLAKTLTQSKCRGRNTKLFYVGFDVNGAFVSVYSVCLNEITNTTLFVIHQMHKAIAHTIPKYVAEYTRGALLRVKFEDIYDCENQKNAISSYLKGKTVDGECCFKKRQLVNPMDVLPGISQVATFHYINVVPHWSCGTENWDEVERRVRQYALKQDKIRVWTGAASVLKNDPTIILKDSLGQELQVPQFIWKVVQDQLAIIHINVPGLTSHQVNSYILCRDMCDSIGWMRNSQWQDFNKGFIYCCNIKEFERVFNYDYIFN